MDKNELFESSIKAALADGEDKIEVDIASLNIVKQRLISNRSKGRYDFNMKNVNNFFRFGMRKTTGAVCALAIITVSSVAFIQPVRTFASDGFETIKSMVYDVVKGENGQYIAVKVPQEEPITTTSTGELPRIIEDGTNETKSNLPETLNGGYKLFNQCAVAYDPNTRYLVSHSSSNSNSNNAPSLKLPEGWKDGISNWYSKGSSTIIVDESKFDCAFVLNSKREPVEGDNKKEIMIGNQEVLYAEYPDARYPLVNDTEDRTQKPTIHVGHTLRWQHNGLYYTMYDFNGDLSLESLKSAAESIINAQK